MLTPTRPTFYLFCGERHVPKKKVIPDSPHPLICAFFRSATGRAKMTIRNLPRVPSRSVIGLQARPAESPLELGSTASEDVATVGKSLFTYYKAI